MRSLAALTAGVLVLSGCAGAERAGEAPRIGQEELQESVERFAGVFVERLVQAGEEYLRTAEPPRATREQAMRQVLLYATALYDIATGSHPEVNLLDLIAFTDLAGATLEEHWVPEVFGEAAWPLQAAFARSAEELEGLAEPVLGPARLAQVHRLAREWRAENPEHVRVESVRLFSFAVTTGQVAGERARQASGLLASVRAMTRSADQALLLGERAVFLAQRMPFLLRLHVRVGLHQLVSDGLLALDRLTPERLSSFEPLFGDATSVASSAGQVAGDARALVEALRPLLEAPRADEERLRVERLVREAGHLAGETREVLGEVDRLERTVSAADDLVARTTTLLHEARTDAGRWFGLAAALGALLLALFWGGYVVARRLTGDRARERPAPAREPARHGARG